MGILPTRPLYRRLLISGVLLGLFVFGAAVWLVLTQGGLQGRIDAIRAAGDPATIADLTPTPIPPEEDAAAQLAGVAGRLDDFSRDLYRFENSPLGLDYSKREDRGEAATTEQLAAIRSIVEKYPEVAVAIKRAAACPKYASRLDYRLPQPQFVASMLPGPINIRDVGRFVARQMKLATAEGKTDVAVEQGIELLRLAARYDAAEPGLTNSQMATAVRWLAVEEIYASLMADAADNGAITPALRQELDRELARFDGPEALRRPLTTERALVISATQYQLDVCMTPLLANTIGLPMKRMYLESIDSIAPALAVVDQPWYVTFQQGKPNIFEPTTSKGAMADLLTPVLKHQFEMVHRTIALQRALRVASALQQYAAEHGKEAGGIGDLSQPDDAIEDPFTGQPLKAKLVDGNWVVYSVGVNGVDDGGDFKDHKDVGVRPRHSKSLDEIENTDAAEE